MRRGGIAKHNTFRTPCLHCQRWDELAHGSDEAAYYARATKVMALREAAVHLSVCVSRTPRSKNGVWLWLLQNTMVAKTLGLLEKNSPISQKVSEIEPLLLLNLIMESQAGSYLPNHRI